jgi:hypothetical protein
MDIMELFLPMGKQEVVKHIQCLEVIIMKIRE